MGAIDRLGGWPGLIGWGIAGAIAGLLGGCGPLP